MPDIIPVEGVHYNAPSSVNPQGLTAQEMVKTAPPVKDIYGDLSYEIPEEKAFRERYGEEIKY